MNTGAVQGAWHYAERSVICRGHIAVNNQEHTERESVNHGITTIKKICDGFDITIGEFFSTEEFDSLEQELLLFIPPYTPKMNPIEQIWIEIRKRGFKNEIFNTLDKVVDRLCDTICSLSAVVIKSITGRDWILSTF